MFLRHSLINARFSGSTVLALSKIASILWFKSIYILGGFREIQQTCVGINGIKNRPVTEIIKVYI
jgi:hypothetical protein